MLLKNENRFSRWHLSENRRYRAVCGRPRRSAWQLNGSSKSFLPEGIQQFAGKARFALPLSDAFSSAQALIS